MAVITAAANCHDSKPLLNVLVEKAHIQPGTRIHADKATRNYPLTHWELQCNNLITKSRYVVERTFGSQVRWFNAETLRYPGLAKAHA
ncbi:hypothetical protein [Nitrosomonas ureae]|uniref:hypothetical protein n=1 Tax=Nitrosomonas ureae TaxID=44577 RepID=UPI000BB88C29|nr:hypothetical protein [Nitrosomonas ureae]